MLHRHTHAHTHDAPQSEKMALHTKWLFIFERSVSLAVCELALRVIVDRRQYGSQDKGDSRSNTDGVSAVQRPAS